MKNFKHYILDDVKCKKNMQNNLKSADHTTVAKHLKALGIIVIVR